MKEQKITKETYELAKEKGFPVDNSSIFLIKNKISDSFNINPIESTKQINNYPTQSLVQKWLREEHNIHVSIQSIGIGTKVYYYEIYYPEGLTGEGFIEKDLEGVYEDILEEALQKALELVEVDKYKLPFRVGRKKQKVVLDVNGLVVAEFPTFDLANEYVEFKNNIPHS